VRRKAGFLFGHCQQVLPAAVDRRLNGTDHFRGHLIEPALGLEVFFDRQGFFGDDVDAVPAVFDLVYRKYMGMGGLAGDPDGLAGVYPPTWS
jgi:hypothetical protein